MTNHTNPNSAAQATERQTMLTADELKASNPFQWLGRRYTPEVAERLLREFESVLLSKLRAPVADERAVVDDETIEKLLRVINMLVPISEGKTQTAADGLFAETRERAATITDARRVLSYAIPILRSVRAALASAPVAPAEVMDALNWVDDFIARCNRDDRGSCESVNVLRRALASAPVAGHQPYPSLPKPDVQHPGEQEESYSREAVETAMRAAHDRGYSVGWDHGKEHASAPVAGEAVAHAVIAYGRIQRIVVNEERAHEHAEQYSLNAEAAGWNAKAHVRPLVYGDAAPQASAALRASALEEAAHLMEQTGKRIAASDIRALKQPQADKDGGAHG